MPARNIRKRGNSYQVRVGGLSRTEPTLALARRAVIELELELRNRNQTAGAPISLGEAIDVALRWIRATRAPRPKTIQYLECSAKFWEPLRDTPLSNMRLDVIEDMITERSALHPQSAKNELAFLKRVLREAKRRGQEINETILGIPAVRHQPREGRALTVGQLYELASWCPAYISRMFLLAGLIGCRQRVWFSVTDEMLDLDSGTLTTPSSLAKNRREHRIYLTEGEAQLFREQLEIRPKGTSLIFPTPEGKQWTASRFRDRVWVRAVEGATNNNGSALEERSVFDQFTFHELRHTATSLMMAAGMDPAVIAERLQHSDGGALLLKKYNHLYPAQKREQAARLDSLVRAVLDTEWTKDPDGSRDRPNQGDPSDGRYWARTSDPPACRGGPTGIRQAPGGAKRPSARGFWFN